MTFDTIIVGGTFAGLSAALYLGPGAPLGAGARRLKASNVPGVYVSGDITRMAHTVTFACPDSGMAALAIHRSLVSGC